jgi:hypothetical protein
MISILKYIIRYNLIVFIIKEKSILKINASKKKGIR